MCQLVKGKVSKFLNMKYELIAFIRPLAASEPEVLQALFLLGENSRQEPGCERWELFRDRKDPSTLVAMEVYRDEAAFQEHAQAPYTRDSLARVNAGSEGGSLEIVVLGPVEV
jgi:quinol monooxygenase YgiN